MKDLSKRKMMSTEAVQSGTEEPSTVEKMKTRVRSGEIATFNLLSWATLQDGVIDNIRCNTRHGASV